MNYDDWLEEPYVRMYAKEDAIGKVAERLLDRKGWCDEKAAEWRQENEPEDPPSGEAFERWLEQEAWREAESLLNEPLDMDDDR